MTSTSLPLPPGFRFHPTDEELILHYLCNRAAAAPCPVSIIAEVDIYKFDPWDLPAKALFGEHEWYFFSPRDRKYPNGIRPNRAAASGYWKATGTDKPIHATTRNNQNNIGVKKALVFYKGRPPKGIKTNWIMHEYRLAQSHADNSYRPMRLKDSSMRLDDWVLCRIYKKSNNPSTVQQQMMDHEPDDLALDDVYNSTIPRVVLPQEDLSMHKSSSLSELLNVLFDNPAQVLGMEPSLNTCPQSLVDINNRNSKTQPSESQGLLLTDEASLYKRERAVDGCIKEVDGFSQPSKRLNGSCILPSIASQLDNTPYGVSGSLLGQQLLLNSHLGFH